MYIPHLKPILRAYFIPQVQPPVAPTPTQTCRLFSLRVRSGGGGFIGPSECRGAVGGLVPYIRVTDHRSPHECGGGACVVLDRVVE